MHFAIDVLEMILSNNKMLNPTDHSTNHTFDAGVQLYHNFIDATGLTLQESALRIVEIITPRSSEK